MSWLQTLFGAIRSKLSVFFGSLGSLAPMPAPIPRSIRSRPFAPTESGVFLRPGRSLKGQATHR